MATSSNINDRLKNYFSEEAFSAFVPESDKHSKARQLVLARKRKADDQADLFMVFASFLNLKIKLYHAVIVLLLVSSIILLLNKRDTQRPNHMSTSDQTNELVAAKNSTVLSCIQTFVSPK